MNNLCSTLSALGEHERALNWALDAVQSAETVNIPEALPVALHNLGIEYESLGEHDSAMSNYGRALRLSTERFGVSSALSVGIRSSIRSARDAVRRRTIIPNGGMVFGQDRAPLFQMPQPKTRPIPRSRRHVARITGGTAGTEVEGNEIRQSFDSMDFQIGDLSF